MAILKKAKSALKKVASKVYTTLNPIVKSVSSALTAPVSTKGQTAGVFNAVVGEGLNKQQKQQAYNALDKVSGSTSSQNLLGQALTSSRRGTSSNIDTGILSSVSSGLSSKIPTYGPAVPTSFNAGTKMTSDMTSDSYNPYASTSLSSIQTTPLNQTVSSTSLSSPSISTPSTPGATNYQGTAVGGNVGLGAEPTTGMLPTSVATGAVPEEEAPQKDSFQEMLKSLKGPVDEAKMYEKAQRESGLQEAQQRVANTQNQINAITAKMNTDLLQLRGTAQKEGVVEAVYGGQQAQVTREAAIALLPLQAQLSADQGNLEMAQERLDTLFNIYTKDAQRSVDFYNDQVKSIYEYSTAQEKKKLDEQLYQKNFIKSQIDDTSATLKDAMSQFLREGNQAGLNALKQIRPPVNINSPTIERDYQRYVDDVNNVLARYGVQPVSTPEAGTYTPKQLTAISKLNQDVSKNSTYSKTTSMRNYGDNVIASLSLGSGVGDISAINQFQKVIDEGAVTRDQDVKLIQGSQSLANTLKTKIKKLEKGEQLSPELRQQMRTAVEAMYNKQVEALQKDPYIKAKTSEAKLYGVNPSDTILGELGAFTTEQPSQTENQPVDTNVDYRSKYGY